MHQIEVLSGNGLISRRKVLWIWSSPKFYCLVKSEINRINHYQTTNIRLFQTERVCRRQFQI